MSAKIIGYEQTISKIFGDDFVYEIPLYQRPYAWTKENAEELLLDLLAYLEDGKDIEDIEPYFLGSIVLIKKEHTPDSKVVDGQQRLTTLTILLAVLRHLEPNKDDRDILTEFIYEKGHRYHGTRDRFRLTLRDKDAQFFQKHVQDDETAIFGLERLDPKQLETDSQRRIRENALHLLNKLQETEPQVRQQLTEFILRRCYLVVVAAETRETAYRVFSVLNDRGLDLSFTDILKADIIGEIDEHDRDRYGKKWEDMEDDLGRDSFADLFTHIRMINRKVKAQGTTLEEIRKYVKPQDNPIDFIDNTLIPYSDSYYQINTKTFDASETDKAQIVNDWFDQLQSIDNFDWVPPAMLYLSEYHSELDRLLRFFSDLERLAASMMICRATANSRIQRYGDLITAIQNGEDLNKPESPLQLKAAEQKETINYLIHDVYEQKPAKYILLRLDRALVSDEARYKPEIITIEHVLPQNPSPESQWRHWFPREDDRVKWVHKLANLVLLSRRKNSRAQNYDFEIKKRLYFADHAAPFHLTGTVLAETEWTPTNLAERQNKLISKLVEVWRLHDGDGEWRISRS